MQDVDDWLAQYRHDAAEVTDELRKAITDFVLVWSFFESRVLAQANHALHQAHAIAGQPYEKSNMALIEKAAKHHVGDITGYAGFESSYDYFRSRGAAGVNFSEHLEDLIQNNGRALNRIGGVFHDEPSDFHAKVEALLLVAYCLRTNLVHGYKWHGGLAGQEVNFDHATQVLMLAVDHQISPN